MSKECPDCGNERVMVCPNCEHDFSESSKAKDARIAALEAENKRLAEERDGWQREAKLSRTILEELKKQKEYEIANRLIPGGALLCSAMGSLCHQLLDARSANDARARKEDGK